MADASSAGVVATEIWARAEQTTPTWQKKREMLRGPFMFRRSARMVCVMIEAPTRVGCIDVTRALGALPGVTVICNPKAGGVTEEDERTLKEILNEQKFRLLSEDRIDAVERI